MTKEEKANRAKIAQEFREEIRQHGLKNAIMGLLDSVSEKAPLKKTVLAQQCRKPNFKKEFVAACEEIGSFSSKLYQKIWAFYHEVVKS